MVGLSIEVTHGVADPCLVSLAISISTQVIIAEIATERAVKRLVVVLTLVQARMWGNNRLFGSFWRARMLVILPCKN